VLDRAGGSAGTGTALSQSGVPRHRPDPVDARCRGVDECTALMTDDMTLECRRSCKVNGPGEDAVCVVCTERPAIVVLRQCCHRVFCVPCLKKFLRLSYDARDGLMYPTCPICRQRVVLPGNLLYTMLRSDNREHVWLNDPRWRQYIRVLGIGENVFLEHHPECGLEDPETQTTSSSRPHTIT
jgi:hypothetical protein